MKVVATVRTRDEEANIGPFCAAYQDIADLILVADGGSEDRTVAIAEEYPKTKVLHFEERMDVQGGHWINPQGKHVNFLFDHALAEGADWIIFDDCDCVPNFVLREHARYFFETVNKPALFVRRVYFWGTDKIFPRLHKPNTGLWAFNRRCPVRADEEDPWHLTMRTDRHTNLVHLRPVAMHLEFPYCLLHYSWPTEKATQDKLDFYRTSGVQPSAAHPRNFAGPLADPEWFMKERPDDVL